MDCYSKKIRFNLYKFLRQNLLLVILKYTKIFSITDYHKQINTPTKGFHPKFGFALIEDELWDKTKADYCRRENIDFHIDDTLAYNDYFTTPFCRLWLHNNDKS